MNRLAEVSACDSCPNVWMYLGVDPCCLLMNKKPCYDKDMAEEENIPAWCPLPYAKPPRVSCKSYKNGGMCVYQGVNAIGQPAMFCQETGPCMITIREV